MQEHLWADRDRVRALARAEEEDRRKEAAIKEQLRQLKLEGARERLKDTLAPLEEGARQLHATVFEAAVAMRESLRKNHVLHGSSGLRIRRARDTDSAVSNGPKGPTSFRYSGLHAGYAKSLRISSYSTSEYGPAP